MNIRKPFDPSPSILVYGVDVNRDQTAFVAACEDGFRVYDTTDSRLLCFREFSGPLQHATILKKSNILALLGGRQSAPKECPRGEVVIWNNATNEVGVAVGDGHSRPLRVLISDKFFIPVCETGLAIFLLSSRMEDFTARSLVHSYSTVSNPHAVAVLGSRYLAFPGISKGKLQLVDLAEIKASILNAHTSHLRAIALSADEKYIATASDKGTLVRIWSTTTKGKIREFRRGLEEAAVFSLAFSPDRSLLALTSDKGTIHIFELEEVESVQPRKSSEHQRRPSDNYTSSSKASSHRHASFSSKRPSEIRRDNAAKRLSFPPATLDDMSQSTVLTSPDPADFDPGMPTWTHVSQATQAQKKSARFQDRPPTSILSGDSYGYTQSDYAPPSITAGSTTSTGTVNANPSKKYGSLANLPFAPRIMKDQYSVCSAPFTLPGRTVHHTTLDESAIFTPPPTIPPPTIGVPSSSSHRRIPSAPQGKTLTRGLLNPTSMAQGAPPKGQIAWIGDLQLVVVSAGRGGRWEKYEIERGSSDGRPWRLHCLGWKAYLSEEGN
ncbi:WD40 repeat-like protein [Microthyrium microscopicum]|uniref:WD40 repeat-like protein n=1 Tax=Microthyrium microscopicum TaxID=703497 RepID=A0A6A6UL96_9PEZI|nr:WD40 repeat-like protein [Microthyrium microscopicum]